MNDTPETDALREAIDNGAATEAEMTSLAGKLERERDEARAWAEKVERNALQHSIRAEAAERERDEAREIADQYRTAFCSAKGNLVPQVFPWEAAK